MATITTDQYHALAKLKRWYNKYTHQIIEISGVAGTGVNQVIQEFINHVGFDPREVMYLSYDQRQVLELAYKRYHAYYINGIIYKYTRIVDMDTIPVINPNSVQIEYEWKRDVRKKIDPRYKLIIVYDSLLLNHRTIDDLTSFGLPIILVRDPMRLPAPDTYTFLREPNIELYDLHPDLIKSPMVYFANKVLRGERLDYGSYDCVSIVPRKQMNLYNLKSADMILTMTEDISDNINDVYRKKIKKFSTPQNWVGERLICMSDMHTHRIVNPDEKNIKIYLTRGVVGYLTKCNRHAIGTKYVPIQFRPEFYHESFEEMYMDRHYLNEIELPSRQQIPDEICKFKYAYALSVPMARLGHWDKTTIIVEGLEDEEMSKRMLYSALVQTKSSSTIIM